MRGGSGELGPVLRGQIPFAQRVAVHHCLTGNNTGNKLFRGHFQRENANRFSGCRGNVGCDVQRETGFSHTGAGADQYQVRTSHAGKYTVQSRKTGLYVLFCLFVLGECL